MTTKQIDFYTSIANTEIFACRLAQTVYRNNTRLLVLLEDKVAQHSFSTRLWCLGETVFIPHCAAEDKISQDTPIWLSVDIPAGDCPPVLLNLTSRDARSYAERFTRILEIVGRKETDLAYARERFRYYRECHFEIKHHNMGNTQT